MQPQLFSPASGSVQRGSSQKRKVSADERDDDGHRVSTASRTDSADDDEANDDSDDDSVIQPAGFPVTPLPKAFHLPAPSQQDNLDVGRWPQRNLRRQHLAAINTLLHRCLLLGDYTQASHAFAILLRLKVHNQRIDLRKQSLWEIGAEILLYRGDAADASRSPGQTGACDSSRAFPEGSFKQTKAFLERLILQHPFRKTHPHSVDELTFYVALFGVWVYQIQAKYTDKSPSTNRANPSDDDSAVDEFSATEPASSSTSDEAEPLGTYTSGSSSTNQLNDAQDVAEAMASLTILPPYDRCIPILELQADICDWMADLTIEARGTDNAADDLRCQSQSIRQRIAQLRGPSEQ